AALCSDARLTERGEENRIAGTPTETALLRLALDFGVDVHALRARRPLRDIAYRSHERQYMATTHQGRLGRRLVAIKGNPEQVLALCDGTWQGGRRRRLSERMRRAILDENRRMAGEGLRVLGFARAEIAAPDADTADVADIPALTWAGLIGLADPARQGIAELIAKFD